MLRKLFKYDRKYVSRIMLPIYGALIACTVLFCFLLYMQSLWESTAYFFTGTIFLYIVALIAVAVVPTILIAVRIFSNLYGDEGYLMHTLPVKPSSHIWSKCWTMILFEAASLLFMLISFLMIAFSMIWIFHIPFSEAWYAIRVAFSELWKVLKTVFSSNDLTAMFVLGVFNVIISPFYTFFLIFSACSLGQRARKHKVLAAFGAYFGISFAVYIINQIVGMFSILSSSAAFMENFEIFTIMFGPMLCEVILSFVLAIAGYIFSKHSVEKRLNLE